MFCLVSKYQEVHVFSEICMPHAMQIRQTGGPEVLNWTAVDVAEPGSGQVRLRQAAAGLNYIDVYHRTGYYPQPLPFIPGLEGAGTVEAVERRDALEASANELFEVVASGKVRINVNQRIALKDAAA